MVMMNILIAIMSTAYDNAQGDNIANRLQEICGMISDNEYLVDRANLFPNTRYLIVAQPQTKIEVEDI